MDNNLELGYFETSSPNDPKLMLNTTDPMYDIRVYVTGISESQTSPRFGRQPAVFELQAIFETSAPNDCQMALNTARINV